MQGLQFYVACCQKENTYFYEKRPLCFLPETNKLPSLLFKGKKTA